MFSVSSFFKKIGTVLHIFYTKEGGAIQAVLSGAMDAASVAGSVAAIVEPAGSHGEPAPVIAEIAKIQDGLSLISKAVTSESTATDLNGHAADLTELITGLVSSGDINVKSAHTQAAIGVMATKVQSVVGVLETAANVAPVA